MDLPPGIQYTVLIDNCHHYLHLIKNFVKVVLYKQFSMLQRKVEIENMDKLWASACSNFLITVVPNSYDDLIVFFRFLFI